VVLLEGTAMSAWQVRAQSRDVDLFTPEVPAEAVEAVERELRARYGDGFRLDVTSGENVWGSIIVRDITASPLVGAIDDVQLRALSIEDLFLLKLASARHRDLADLDLLAPRTNADALITRWNQLVKWHGDRHAILGFADAFVVQMVKQYGWGARSVIERLELTRGHRELLVETYTKDGSDGSP